jgi:hypothetical protein
VLGAGLVGISMHSAVAERREALLLARSLQIGLAVEVIAITSVAANLAAILGGILVFGEGRGSPCRLR